MKDDSFNRKAQRTMMSDEQTDSLLRDFFRLEVPIGLSQPWRRVQPPALAVMAPKATGDGTKGSQSRPVRLIVVATSIAAMGLAVLIVSSGNDSPPVHSSTVTNGTNDGPGITPVTDKPMLVSPEGDSRTSGKSISPDGVTLEETDSIRLHR